MDNSSSLDALEEKKQQRRDFWLGVAGCVLGNIFLAVLYFGSLMLLPAIFRNQPQLAPYSDGSNSFNEIAFSLVYLCLNILPWLVNIVALILVLVKRRPWIALGFLAVYGVVFILSLIAGILFAVICFVSLSNL